MLQVFLQVCPFLPITVEDSLVVASYKKCIVVYILCDKYDLASMRADRANKSNKGAPVQARKGQHF